MWVMDCSVLKCQAFIPVAWACTAARGGLPVMILYYKRALSARSMWLFNTDWACCNATVVPGLYLAQMFGRLDKDISVTKGQTNVT